jgi:hypothetical protein
VLWIVVAILAAFWIHVSLFRAEIIQGDSRQNFATYMGWWLLLFFVLSWAQVAVATYLFVKVGRRAGILASLEFVAIAGTIAFILAGLSSY